MIKRAAIVLTLGASSFAPASASFLDSDFWCRTYGCAVVYDTTNYEIYDNWRFATNSCCVAYGSQMQAYYARPQLPRETGSTTVANFDLDSDEGFMLGITEDGSSISTAFSDSNGYLDAGDTLSAFALSSNTDVILDGPGKQYSHSFWISSRNTYFSLRARAAIDGASGDFANTLSLGDIKLTTNVSTNGNDGGFQYGSRANSNNVTILSGIDDLGDISGPSQRLIHFGRFQGIRQRNGDLNDQTVRLDFLYEMPDYDMSMGVGALDVDVFFDLYRELNSAP